MALPGQITVGVKGAKLLLTSATTTVASLSVGSTTAPLMQEAKGMTKWTFWAYDAAGTATFTVVFQGTIDATNVGSTTWSYFNLGTMTNASTQAIIINAPLTGVFAALTAMATTGNITALGFAAP